MMARFNPIRFDANMMLRSDRREEIIEWVKQLGVVPGDVRPCGLIARDEASYQLHLSRFVRDEAGRQVLDLALNEVVSEPLIIDLGQSECWPAWLSAQGTEGL